jgi:nucleotide-binding universal stress UspA family protein
MPPRVLIAVDGSEVSQRALERAARFLKHEAEVALVTVARPIYRDPPYTGYADPKDEEEQRKVFSLHATSSNARELPRPVWRRSATRLTRS